MKDYMTERAVPSAAVSYILNCLSQVIPPARPKAWVTLERDRQARGGDTHANAVDHLSSPSTHSEALRFRVSAWTPTFS